MKIRFQADADLKHAIVSGLLRREPMIDFQTATQAGLAGLNDLEVLRISAREGRVLVTHDNRTMPRALRNGQLNGFSVERLIRFLNALDRDVEILIKAKPRSRRRGQLRVKAA